MDNLSGAKVHFISGLPRSGSTLLAGILLQNPRFQAGMSSPVGGLMNQLLESMSTNSEFAVFISEQQKRDILLGVFSAYYHQQLADNQVIFDTNRLWCSKLPLIRELFPQAKVICCVRNIAWVMDSFERLVRKNALDVSKMFGGRGESATVYSRTEALSGGNRIVGFAYNGLKEAFYSEDAEKLLLVDYELLTQNPKTVIDLIYQFVEEPPYEHDFNNVEYTAEEFDDFLRTAGLHTVKRKVEFIPRRTVLPPDLFERFSQLTFWGDNHGSNANVISVVDNNNKKQKRSKN
ncbi:MAG: sulfotransferase [Gomphosphaeria aponina SAG 52.96 = DSM 107014]|uniref:Sulfotransferase n=1 Tax=Gomphosphaeria aponina SAG 52.96 = DSM 107014 TaxID=1521640 RepID=A0A941JPH7_9CHRO|nr:sulfotransferase [Gomphosphaeria aponina SAG 52.96 = DSM 107014]